MEMPRPQQATAFFLKYKSMREANFLTDKTVLVTVPIPVGVTLDSNQLKYYFSNSNTNCLDGKIINRIRFWGVETQDGATPALTKVNGVIVYAPFPATVIYFTLVDKNRQVLIDKGNLFDYSQSCFNIDGAARPIYAPVRRMCLTPDWSKSYLTLVTTAPVTRVAPSFVTLSVSYTNPV